MEDNAGHNQPDPGQAGQGETKGPTMTAPEGVTGFEPVYSLDLNEVSAQFDDAQLPRSRRTLLRYCQHDKLDCTKVETMHGEQYFVSEPSVARLIAEIVARERFTRPPQGGLPPAVTPDIPHESGQGAPGHVAVGPAQIQPANAHSDTGGQAEAEPLADQGEPRQGNELSAVDERLLKQLERENGLIRDQLEKKDVQIDKKDKQIDDLIERGREDKMLIQNFQRKLGMLEAPEEGRTPRYAQNRQERVSWQNPDTDSASDTSPDGMV